MMDLLNKPTEEEGNHLESTYEEDDEETRDFYIYILSREHPTVLTPVANPYKRSDRIKEANAELQTEAPLLSGRSAVKIRFNEKPMLHEYVKQEDILSLSSGDSSPSENNHSPINHNATKSLINGDARNQQPVVKPRHINGWSNEPKIESQNINNRSSNKENTQPIEEGNSECNKISNIQTDLDITNGLMDNIISDTNRKLKHQNIVSNEEPFKKIDLDVSHEKYPQSVMEEICNRENVKTAAPCQETNNNKRDYYDDKHTNKEKNHPATKDTSIESTLTNDGLQTSEHTSPEDGKTKENFLNMTAVDMNPILNNDENKLNYRPSSTERGRNYGKTKPVILQNGDKGKEDKFKADVSQSSTKINGPNKKTTAKSKMVPGKPDSTHEATARSVRPHMVKTQKNDGSKAQIKDSQKGKESKTSARARPSSRNSDDLKETNYTTKTKENNEVTETKSSVDEKTENNKTDYLKPKEMLLSTDEFKSKLEELKEHNRNKLVVLVPPFEQYKSYMNDNCSDSDDNESFDLEEFLRKENSESDFAYHPDFELESDDELDKICKDHANVDELEEIYPEDVSSNQKTRKKANGSMRKKDNDSNTSGKRLTRPADDDELRRHQCKMMDNIKRSQQYETSVRRPTQNNRESNVKCKQECAQRPATAPGGRKYCDCKWPRVKLPEYNGLRSEYGLSAEQLCERKRQRQEITKRSRERRQRKVDEEERRKMDNERMFHEWLLKKRQQAKEQWLRNQRLRALRYSRQCITANQSKPKTSQTRNNNTPLAIRKKLHPGRNCFSLDEIINDVTELSDESKSYKVYLGLSIE